MSENKSWQKIIGLLLLIAAAITIIVLYLNGKKLSNYHQVALATITKCEWASRGTARYIVGGIFKVNNKDYYTSCQLSCQSLRVNELQEKLIGLKVPVVFLPENPFVNYLLVEQKDYDFYEVSFADSSKWIYELVQCKY